MRERSAAAGRWDGLLSVTSSISPILIAVASARGLIRARFREPDANNGAVPEIVGSSVNGNWADSSLGKPSRAAFLGQAWPLKTFDLIPEFAFNCQREVEFPPSRLETQRDTGELDKPSNNNLGT
ncbi:hypothetical protein WN51_06956 [Melipona quadrifasciata]|uniref:Uncharacterized protein n=1 Tax=Melipona quadrifasciata TaxID=166423 RepID=A0A0M8ZSN7_9HYME|nr:hypothetical protein WN51_06956 [Melipona quadrifasciata]